MMIAAFVTVIVKGAVVTGGWGQAWESALRSNRVIWDESEQFILLSVCLSVCVSVCGCVYSLLSVCTM